MDLARALTDPSKRRMERAQPQQGGYYAQDGTGGGVFTDPYQGYQDEDTFRAANELGGRGWQVRRPLRSARPRQTCRQLDFAPKIQGAARAEALTDGRIRRRAGAPTTPCSIPARARGRGRPRCPSRPSQARPSGPSAGQTTEGPP